MKTMKKLFFSTIVLIFAGIYSVAYASGKDINRTFTWKYNLSKDAKVEMDNYDCNLVIHTWDKNETEYKMTVDAETRSDEDATMLEKYIQELGFSHSSSSVIFASRFWESRNTIMGRITIKLKGGKSIELKSLEMKGELWIPSGCKFELASKYSEINMDDFAGPLFLDLYNDNLYGGNLEGRTELLDKYSTIEFKDIKELKANLYNSRLDAENAGNLTIQSKYSKIKMTTSGSLDINGYNDKYSISKTGDIIFVGKYSDFETESSGMSDLDCYEGTFVLKEVKDVKIMSKYADFRFDIAGNCSVSSSYNDNLSAGKLNSLFINESKYTTYKINELVTSLSENEGYQDKFSILRTGQQFKELNVNGKYVDISLAIPKAMDYRFRAKIKYPDLDINESAFKPVVKIIEGSQLEYDAIKGTEKEGMPLIEVNGYQIGLKIVEI